MVTKDVIEKPAILAGGGAPEAFIGSQLREWSSTLEGRAQLAVQKFADALDSIPLSLAENAGMDPIDAMAELRAKQSKGSTWAGINVRGGAVADMYKLNVLEPLVVKEQIIKSATEAATMLLRIDDVIAARKSETPAGPPGGGMGGMGDFDMDDIIEPLESKASKDTDPIGTPNELSIDSILGMPVLKKLDSARRNAIPRLEGSRQLMLNLVDEISSNIRNSKDDMTEEQYGVIMFLSHVKERIEEDSELSLEGPGNEFMRFKEEAKGLIKKILPLSKD